MNFSRFGLSRLKGHNVYKGELPNVMPEET